MWKLPLFEARSAVTGTFDTDIVGIFRDSGKKAIPPKGNTAGEATEEYSDIIERLRKGDAFGAKLGSTHFIRFAEKGSAENVLFVGLGIAESLTEEKLRSAGGHVWSKLAAEKVQTAVVHLDSFFDHKGRKSDAEHIRWVRAFAEGLVLNIYHFSKYKSSSEILHMGLSRIQFVTQDKRLKEQLDSELEQALAAAECIRITRDWSNEPSNFGTPTFYAQEAKKLAQQHGLKCKVLTEAEAAREKMGLFLGVGQGSDQENRFVIVEYLPPKSKNPKTIALVGKGVTFDSGGISIKPSARMEEMKHDMTGAATVMGAVLLAARWKIPNRIVAVMAFAENMPSGNAIQPGNIITARNGKTVEVINTDAEGRLVLADALDYVQDYKPDVVVDVATLTGAVSIALGKQCCAVLGNENTLIDSLRKAGDACGERIWQLPLFDEYFEDLKSDTADIKNSVNDTLGGTIRGAMFLKQFIRKNTHWAHLDIAGTAYNLGHLSYFPKRGASGAYVRTLARFAADF